LRCEVKNTDVIDKLLQNGLLTVGAGENVIRVMPPLIIDESHVDEAARIIDKVAAGFAK
jgi:acetylornithine/N-succinyldiaminopimelate aminotransferase